MSGIQQHVIAHINGRVYGVAGYYSDQDATQHVVVATDDGTLYEVHWGPNIAFTSPQRLAQFPGIASLSGFFTYDDGYQHVVVATEDGWLHELYFTDTQHIQSRDHLYQLPPFGNSHIGMAGFYSSDDNLRHVAVGSFDDSIYEVVWNGQVVPFKHSLTTQSHLQDVAGIAGFFDSYTQSRDVIIAMKYGQANDVHYSAKRDITTDVVTNFSPPLVNVAAFVDTNTNTRHISALNANGQVSMYSSTDAGMSGGPSPLITLGNVIDMVGYYSSYDNTNHVILVTGDGNVHEVYYSQQVAP